MRHQNGNIKLAHLQSPINENARIAFSERSLANIIETPDKNIAIIDNDENVFYVSKKELAILGELFSKCTDKKVNQFDLEGQKEFDRANKEKETSKEEEDPFL